MSAAFQVSTLNCNQEGWAMPRLTAEEKSVLLQSYLHKKEALEARLARLMEEVEQVEEEIIEAQSNYGKLLNSGSLLAKLPNELLSMIFHLTQQATRINDMPQNPIAEVTISHVCSHWRSLALSLPSLWSVFRYEGQASPRVPLDRLEAFLKRSQQHPIDIWLDFTAVGVGWPEQSDMLDLVPPHIGHCRRLHILSDNDCSLDDLYLNLRNVSAPMLEVFAMCSDAKSPPDPIDLDSQVWKPSVFLLGAPMLQYVRLDAISALNIHPPINSIAHLRLEKRQEGSFTNVGFRVSTLDHILSLPGLQTLSVFGSFFDIQIEDFHRRIDPIHAQSLKHFRCGNSLYGPVHLYFLAHVSAPVLETITFHKLHFNHDGFDIPDARLTYSYPSLLQLALLDLDGPHINFQGHDPAVIGQVMTLTQNIKALIFAHIALSHEPSHLLLQMIIVGSGTNSWANLEHMIIFDPGLPRVTCMRLIDQWPKPRNIHLSQAFISNVVINWPHPSAVSLQTIEGLHQLSPPYWPPGFDWMDNEEDPFHLDIGTVMFTG